MMQPQHEPAPNNSFRVSQCRGSLPLKKRRFLDISTFQESAVVHHLPQGSAGDPLIPLSTSDSSDSSKTTPTAQSRPRIHHPPLAVPKPGGCHGRTSRNNSYCRRTPRYNGSNYCKLHYQQYVVQGGGHPNGIGGSAARSNCIKSEAPEMKSDRLQSSSSHNSTVAIVGGDNAMSHYRHHQDKRYTGLCLGEIQCCATTTRGRPCAYVAATAMKYCHLHADYDTNPPPRRGGAGSSYKTKTATELVKSESLLNRETEVDHANVVESIVGRCDQLGLSLNSQYEGSDSSNGLQVPDKMKSSPSPTSSTASLSSLEPFYQNPTASIGDGHNPTSKPCIYENKLPSFSYNAITVLNPPPYPLLNSIPSDKWSHRLVLISTGPLVNHIGRVVRWGNGWITVSTQTGADGSSATELLHNRRAIELYLLPEDIQLPLEESKVLPNCGFAASLSVNEVLPPRSGYKLSAHEFTANHESPDGANLLMEEKKHKEESNSPCERIVRHKRADKTTHLTKKDDMETAIKNTSDMTQPLTECIVSSLGAKVYSDVMQSPLDEKDTDALAATSDESRTKCKLVVSRDVVVDELRLVKSLEVINLPLAKEVMPPHVRPHISLKSLIQVAIKGDESSDINCVSLMEKITLPKNVVPALPGPDGKVINKLERKSGSCDGA